MAHAWEKDEVIARLMTGLIDGQVRFDDEIEMTAGNRNDVHFREQAIPSE